jgi:glycosyltransferase involved in cell wall biosynthesis
MGARPSGAEITPRPVLFVEKSTGVSGSTISLCSLVNRIDRGVFEPCIAVSQADQAIYLRAHLRQPTEVTVIGPAKGLKARSRTQRGYRRSVLGWLDLVLVTLPYALALWRFARARRAALLHQNNGFDEAALLAARLLGAPLVAYQRGGEWKSRLVRLLAPRVTRYLANSEATKADLLSLGIAGDRIAVVYPPIDLGDFGTKEGKPPRRSDFGVPATAPSFGIVGQLLAWKGHRVFLEAARRVCETLPGARAWVVGEAPPGREGYLAQLRDLVRALGIEEKVVFTGFVQDVPGVMRLLDVVVHASVKPEPFGRVVAEAMAAKRPVVASNAGGPTEIIVDGRTGFLVPPGDAEALAERILTLLRDRDLAEQMADRGYREATARFSADAHARTIETIYAGLLNGRNRGGRVQP